MAKKETALTVASIPISETVIGESPNLRELQRAALVEGGMLAPRTKYGSLAERKAARKARAKGRRRERRAFLEQKGLAEPKRPKLTKEQKKVKSKGLRRARNIYLKEHPEFARTLGVDVKRLRVF